MSLYNMLFGVNESSDVLLATLGLTRASVGRFRDVTVAQGEIAVYTRNGGGNRECSHEGESKYGNSMCKHHTTESEEDEYTTSGLIQKTGKRVMRTWYHCEEPNSKACGCYGCVITYRLPEHPLYLRDEDGDFDNTYATIFFKFPEEYAEDLQKMNNPEPFDPSAKWMAMLDALKAVKP